MLFNSLSFGVFFLIVFAAHAALTGRARNHLLFAASLVFYAAWDWRFLGLILGSTIIDFFCARRIAARRGAPEARRWLWVSVSANLGALGLFKYFDFFVASFGDLLTGLGFDVQLGLLHLVLPVGISFYTFQTMSYTIDVFRGELEPVDDFFDLALFVTFFPQLVAGPIERAKRLLPQITSERKLELDRVASGAQLIAWGLFKKVYVADNLAKAVADPVFTPGSDATGLTVLLGVYAFAFQIYCDFSGYTDIARGCARALGFELLENFRWPYLAANPREFWSRWHISLSTWLRDYLYVSLGGNRTGKTGRNLMLTMLLGGLWHGAAWNFVLWGLYQGLLLVGHRAVVGRRPPSEAPLWRRGLAITGFFQLVCLGWLLFRAEDTAHIADLLGRLFGGGVELAPAAVHHLKALLLYVTPLVAVEVYQVLTERRGDAGRLPAWGRGLVYSTYFWLFMTLGEFGGAQFIYFQF